MREFRPDLVLSDFYLEGGTAIDVLKVLEQAPDRPLELEKRSLRLASKLLELCYQTKGEKIDAETKAKDILKNGEALKQFRRIIKAQYGNPDVSYKTVKINSLKNDFSRAYWNLDEHNIQMSPFPIIMYALSIIDLFSSYEAGWNSKKGKKRRR